MSRFSRVSGGGRHFSGYGVFLQDPLLCSLCFHRCPSSVLSVPTTHLHKCAAGSHSRRGPCQWAAFTVLLKLYTLRHRVDQINLELLIPLLQPSGGLFTKRVPPREDLLFKRRTGPSCLFHFSLLWWLFDHIYIVFCHEKWHVHRCWLLDIDSLEKLLNPSPESSVLMPKKMLRMTRQQASFFTLTAFVVSLFLMWKAILERINREESTVS